MDYVEHRRRRWWSRKCVCGQRWPCQILRDRMHRTQDGEKRQPPGWTGSTVQGGVQ